MSDPEKLEYTVCIYQALSGAGYAGTKLAAADLEHIASMLPSRPLLGYVHLDTVFESDLTRYDTASLKHRGALRAHKHFRIAVERLWLTMEARGDLSLNTTTGIVYIAQEPYIRLQLRLYHALCPAHLDWAYEDVLANFTADWRHDCTTLANGTQVLEYDYFFHHIFNLIDVWTFTASTSEALALISTLMGLMEERPSQYIQDPSLEGACSGAHALPGASFFRSGMELTVWRPLNEIQFAATLHEAHMDAVSTEAMYDVDESAAIEEHRPPESAADAEDGNLQAGNGKIRLVQLKPQKETSEQSTLESEKRRLVAEAQRGLKLKGESRFKRNFAKPPPSPKTTAEMRGYTLWAPKERVDTPPMRVTPPPPKRRTKYDDAVKTRPPIWTVPFLPQKDPTPEPRRARRRRDRSFRYHIAAADFGKSFRKLSKVRMGSDATARTGRIYETGPPDVGAMSEPLRNPPPGDLVPMPPLSQYRPQNVLLKPKIHKSRNCKCNMCVPPLPVSNFAHKRLSKRPNHQLSRAEHLRQRQEQYDKEARALKEAQTERSGYHRRSRRYRHERERLPEGEFILPPLLRQEPYTAR